MQSTASKVCAACGKQGQSVDIKRCTCCKDLGMEVRYCSRDCQKQHRKTHKYDCEPINSLGVIRYHVFNPKERPMCQICMLPLPLDAKKNMIHSCCGVEFCIGCWDANINAIFQRNDENASMGLPLCKFECPFCKMTFADLTNEEILRRFKKGIQRNDPCSVFRMACTYEHGRNGLPVDEKKALELYMKASKLGHYAAPNDIARCFEKGLLGLEINHKKRKEYLELAASRGHVQSHFWLGEISYMEGNDRLAEQYFCIAAEAGIYQALSILKNMLDLKQIDPSFRVSLTTEKLEQIEFSCEKAQKEMQSDNRALAAALDEDRE